MLMLFRYPSQVQYPSSVDEGHARSNSEVVPTPVVGQGGECLPVTIDYGVVGYPGIGASKIRLSARVSSVWERLTASIMASVLKPGYCGDSAWAFVVCANLFCRVRHPYAM